MIEKINFVPVVYAQRSFIKLLNFFKWLTPWSPPQPPRCPYPLRAVLQPKIWHCPKFTRYKTFSPLPNSSHPHIDPHAMKPSALTLAAHYSIESSLARAVQSHESVLFPPHSLSLLRFTFQMLLYPLMSRENILLLSFNCAKIPSFEKKDPSFPCRFYKWNFSGRERFCVTMKPADMAFILVELCPHSVWLPAYKFVDLQSSTLTPTIPLSTSAVFLACPGRTLPG